MHTIKNGRSTILLDHLLKQESYILSVCLSVCPRKTFGGGESVSKVVVQLKLIQCYLLTPAQILPPCLAAVSIFPGMTQDRPPDTPPPSPPPML